MFMSLNIPFIVIATREALSGQNWYIMIQISLFVVSDNPIVDNSVFV